MKSPRKPGGARRGQPWVEREDLAVELAAMREDGRVRRVVLTNGCFDLLHVGHLRYLEDASDLGDFLIVALNTDPSIRAAKGPGRPVVPFEERAELISALRCVDRVTRFDEPTLEETLRLFRPDVHAKGSDYTSESVPEAAIDHELGIEIAICGGVKEHSTTDLLRAARESSSQGPADR